MMTRARIGCGGLWFPLHRQRTPATCAYDSKDEQSGPAFGMHCRSPRVLVIKI